MKCALCQHWTAKDASGEQYKLAAYGLGRCKAEKTMAVFVRWDDDEYCSKAEPARNMEARIEWVSKRERGG